MTIFIISTSMNTFHWFVNGIWLSMICAHLSDSNFRSSSFQKKKSSPNENSKKFCAWWTFVLILKPNEIGWASVDSHMLYSKSMKEFVAILLNLVIAIFEKSSNEHFRRTSRGRIDENCSWGRQWRWSFNFPLSFPRGIDRPKIFIRQTRRNRDQTNTIDLFYKFALACVQFHSVCEAEYARVLTCQKNNQPTKKEREEKNKHWNTILWYGSSIEKILVHRRMVERVRKKDDGRHATRQENNRCVPA